MGVDLRCLCSQTLNVRITHIYIPRHCELLYTGIPRIRVIDGNYVEQNTTQIASLKKSESEYSMTFLIISCLAYAIIDCHSSVQLDTDKYQYLLVFVISLLP
jgi:hypothetical protein